MHCFFSFAVVIRIFADSSALETESELVEASSSSLSRVGGESEESTDSSDRESW